MSDHQKPNRDLYPNEFEKIEDILRQYLPDDFDYKKLQLEIIDAIDLAKSEFVEDGLFDALIQEEKEDKDARKRLNKAIKQFREVYQETNVIKATWQIIHRDLTYQNIDHEQIKPILDAIQAASEVDSKRDKWLKTYDTRGAKRSGKNAFAFYVASKLKGQLKSYPTARLVSDLLDVFDIDSSAGAINSAFERKGVFSKKS